MWISSKNFIVLLIIAANPGLYALRVHEELTEKKRGRSKIVERFLKTSTASTYGSIDQLLSAGYIEPSRKVVNGKARVVYTVTKEGGVVLRTLLDEFEKHRTAAAVANPELGF